MKCQHPKVPSLEGARLEVVKRAFVKLAQEEAGTVPLSAMKMLYNAAAHPRVLDGSISQSKARALFESHFTHIPPEGAVTWDDFASYYTKASTEIDAGRDIDPDASFVQMVIRAWRLDEDGAPRFESTGILPTTLERPSGYSATVNMDLVWKDENGGLVGYRHVVKPLFSRAELPDEIRGYFALPVESTRANVRFLPAQAALVADLDLVWPKNAAEPSGEWTGYRAAVRSNVDTRFLPALLQNYILPFTRTSQMNVTYNESVKIQNPVYKKTSQTYGVGAKEHCAQVAELKKLTWEGKAAGNVFAGKTGKFSDQFKAGCYRNSGLNVSVKGSALQK